MASLTFYGATRGVTGSAYLLKTKFSLVLLECGLIQGSHEQQAANDNPFPFPVGQLDAVVLSHAHLDHSGRLPKLVFDGYSSPVYTTQPTRDLLDIMLKDAAFLEEKDTEWENKRRRQGEPKVLPLFTLQDVESALTLCKGIHYEERTRITKDIEVRFQDAGHILGSAIVEIFIYEDDNIKKLVFSGDLGNSCAALLRDPTTVNKADILLLESTYGDRNHRPMNETLDEFEDILTQAYNDGGNVLIPAFAVGRTQEIIFRLGELYQQGKLAHQAVYLDSPMAIAATEVYHKYQKVFNADDLTAIESSTDEKLRSFLPILRYSRSAEESMAINKIQKGAIIIAGSGMCNGGRIRHHLKHNAWRKNCHIIIVGFQVIGTPGRALVDGAKTLRFGGEDVPINAMVHTLGGFSAHAGQSQLLQWAENFTVHPKLVLIHGEDKAKNALAERFKEKNWPVTIPDYDHHIDF